jgi:hypothetical protein
MKKPGTEREARYGNSICRMLRNRNHNYREASNSRDAQ